MHVIRRDGEKALAVYDDMQSKSLIPSKDSYGYLIQLLSSKNMLEQAFRVLEDSADRSINLRELHIKHLRHTCERLGIIHPNLPADPLLWLKKVKEVRLQQKNRSKRNIQPIQSALYS
jgi:pentatricopeptide repeat protein